MASLGPTHLISLLLAVATFAAVCGFIASTVVRKNKRRARGYLLVGFCCGFLAGGILRGRRRRLNALGAIMRCGDFRALPTVISDRGKHFAARTATFAVSRVRLGSGERAMFTAFPRDGTRPPFGGYAIPTGDRPFARQTAQGSNGKVIVRAVEAGITSRIVELIQEMANVSRLVSQLGIEDPLTAVVARVLEVPIREVYAVLWRAGVIEMND